MKDCLLCFKNKYINKYTIVLLIKHKSPEYILKIKVNFDMRE